MEDRYIGVALYILLGYTVYAFDLIQTEHCTL